MTPSRFFMETCQLNNMVTIKSMSMALREYCITNLVFHDLIMEIVQNLSFIIHMFYTLISCIENTFDTWILKKI